MKKILFTAILLFVASLAYSGGWVYLGTNIGFNTAVAEYADWAVDTNGQPVVIFADQTKQWKMSMYKYTNLGSWISVTNGFSSNVINYASIASRNSTFYIIFSDQTAQFKGTIYKYTNLCLTNISRPYLITNGFTSNISQELTSLIDASNNLWIAFADAANKYKTTVFKYTNGQKAFVVGTAGFSSNYASMFSFALSTNNVKYLAYKDVGYGNKIVVVQYTNANIDTNKGNWKVIYTSGDQGDLPVLKALNNDLYLAYLNKSKNLIHVVKFTNNAGYTWSTNGSRQVVTSLSFDVDNNGVFYLAYSDSVSNKKLSVSYMISNRIYTNIVANNYSITFTNTVSNTITNAFTNTPAYSYVNYFTNVSNTIFTNASIGTNTLTNTSINLGIKVVLSNINFTNTNATYITNVVFTGSNLLGIFTYSCINSKPYTNTNVFVKINIVTNTLTNNITFTNIDTLYTPNITNITNWINIADYISTNTYTNSVANFFWPTNTNTIIVSNTYVNTWFFLGEGISTGVVNNVKMKVGNTMSGTIVTTNNIRVLFQDNSRNYKLNMLQYTN